MSSNFRLDCYRSYLALHWIAQKLSSTNYGQALSDAGVEERGAVSGVPHDVRDEGNEKRCPGAKRGRRDAGGESPFVREPFQRDAHGAAVNQRSADASRGIERIQRRQGFYASQRCPAGAAEDSRYSDKFARAQPINQPSGTRHEPGLARDEKCKRPLNFRK